MTTPGLKKLSLGMRWLRSRLHPGTLVLGYHRVADEPCDPLSLCISPRRFAEQLELLRKHAYPIRLEDAVNGLIEDSLPRCSVVVTFDDGYKDHLHQAKPILEKYEIPATIFLTTGYLDREYWWSELVRILWTSARLPESLSMTIGGRLFSYCSSEIRNNATLRDEDSIRRHLLYGLCSRMAHVSYVEQQSALHRLREQLGIRASEQQTVSALSTQEMIQLASDGLIEIGSHTVSHPFLNDLRESDQKLEIYQSKTCLEELLGKQVTAFSYPNGSDSQSIRRLVAQAGFHCACASVNDVVWRESNLFALPRFWMHNWDGNKFESWLNHWLKY